jgi:hypothetical protein
VVVLSKAGAQVPVILLFEVVGNADKAAPEQIGATAVNVGIMLVAIVTIAVIIQPLLSVYVMVEVPFEIPVTNPVLLILATAVLEETHGVTTAGVPEPFN